MTRSLETPNRQALEFLTDAVADIEAYRQDPSLGARLTSAEEKLKKALQADPNYLRAVYYDAIVDDLQGKPADAPPKYQRVLDSGAGDEAFQLEVRYNLAVAHYHRYSWSELDRAIPLFTAVIEAAKDPSLRLLARAGRAQAHAMHMIPSRHGGVDVDMLLDHSRAAKADIKEVLAPSGDLFDLLRGRKMNPVAEQAARWAAHNASGMRRMYFADYFDAIPADRREESKEAMLAQALADLETAEHVKKRDWANWCDLGSAHMRLAIARGDSPEGKHHFEEARKYLETVVSTLRPGYGFALYELGRLYRTRGMFREAEEYLQRSMDIEAKYRDLSDATVQREIDLVKTTAATYP